VGKLLTGHNVKIGYLSQHAEELAPPGARTVVEATQRLTGLTPNKARALLGRFLFSGDEADKPLDGLSGGERRRLSLAVLVQSGANVLILDEPTNHLDLESREALEEALRAFTGSLLLVSHDRALLDAVGTRTIAFEDRALRSYVGGWPEYVRVREERRRSGDRAGIAATAKPPASERPAGERPASKKPPANERRRSARHRSDKPSEPRGQRGIEQQIEAAEAALRALEDELADPASWSNPGASARSSERHAEAKRRVDDLYRRWESIAG
jgi:ATP-binding cassette subfamily F protein 3